MKLLFDIEADGLLPTITKIWCIVTKDLDTGVMAHFEPHNVGYGVELLKRADILVGHNIIGYDLPAIWKVTGDWEDKPLIIDTLVCSRCLWPERAGGHSLEAYGKKLGFPKIEHNDFTKFTPAMLKYCKQDVLLNEQVLNFLEEEHGDPFPGYQVYN